jgi:hypothetical protein
MKIAIQGHPIKGREVIQILESLRGKNTTKLNGCVKAFYHIDKGEIRNDYYPPTDYKTYTLEEFKKEFPFKVGDKVITTEGTVGIIDRINLKDSHPYVIKTDVGNFYWCETSILKPYKEMKEERNITLTLDKAKEWYKKGGELKEIALQAFTENELHPLPRSWEEFREKCRIEKNESYINSEGKILSFDTTSKRSWNHICPSRKSAEAHLAMIQLEQLRDCWWNDWRPEYNCGTKYIIKWDKDDLIVATSGRIRAFLIFPTREMAEEFLKCFRDLIEKARDLI